MIDFHSTADEPTPKAELCVIYDARDGRIVHMHEFLGDGTGIYGPDAQGDRERIAFDALTEMHGDVEHLRALHAPTDFRLQPDAIYRVDHGQLVVARKVSLREFIETSRQGR